MHDLVLDFETFYDVNYSLRSQQLSYTDYVRDPRFEVLGCSFRFADDKAAWFVRGPDVRRVIRDIDWKNTRMIAHNNMFDALVLGEHYEEIAGRYFCTLAAARAVLQGACANDLDKLARFFRLGEKLPDLVKFKGLRWADLNEEQQHALARYCDNDVELTWAVFNILAPQLPEKEHRIMDSCMRQFADPVLLVDVPLATEAREEARHDQEVALAKSGYPLEVISSDNAFAELLKAKTGSVPMKPSPSDPAKEIPAFAKDDLAFMELLHHEDESVRNLVAARIAVKSTQPITRAQRLIDIGTKGNCKLAVANNYWGAKPGRRSGANKMNTQNFKRGSKLRRSIKAPPGHVVLVVDSAQIQARWLVTLCGQDDVVEAFAQGRDTYSELATDIYGRPINKKDNPLERFVGKVCRLGLGFGLGWRGLYFQLITGAMGDPVDVDPEFVISAVHTFRSKNDKIVESWSIQEQILRCMIANQNMEFYDGMLEVIGRENMIRFPGGTWLRYPGLEYNEEAGGFVYYRAQKNGRYSQCKTYGGAMTENIVMHLERNTIEEQLLEIGERYHVAMMTHDEGVMVVPEAEADEALEWCIEKFRERPWWAPEKLPLDGEGGYDYCYSK